MVVPPNEKVVEEIALEFCRNFAPQEELILHLSKDKLGLLAKARASNRRGYSEALGVGIAEDILLPTVLYVLLRIGDRMIADGYAFARSHIAAYICGHGVGKTEALFKGDQKAQAVVRKFHRMLCEKDYTRKAPQSDCEGPE